MKQHAKIAHQIRKHFPDFALNDIVKIGEGMDSKAYLVNDAYIFRFPKRAEVRVNLKKEIAVLPKIKPFIQVLLPDFQFIATDTSFVGYPKIDGQFLESAVYSALNPQKQVAFQQDIARFLNAIHAFNLDELTESGLETLDFKAVYQEEFEEIQQLVFPIFNDTEKTAVSKLFTTYLEDDNNFNYTPVLLHNDLSNDHILIDNQTDTLKGIIDFGDVAIGDPDYDLMYLTGDYGADFLDSFLNYYPHSDVGRLKNKIKFFQFAQRLQDIVSAIEDNKQRAIKNSYRNVQNWLNTEGYLFDNQ
jgi:aminoglycoside 2''-phosphotransferase